MTGLAAPAVKPGAAPGGPGAVLAAETTVDRLLSDHLPRLLRTAGELSAE